MTKARTHSRNAFPSPSSWKYVASLRKSTVMVRFSRVGLAAMPMCHPSVIRSRKLMKYDGGNAWQSQDHREGLRALPLKAMECEISCFLLAARCGIHQWVVVIPGGRKVVGEHTGSSTTVCAWVTVLGQRRS